MTQSLNRTKFLEPHELNALRARLVLSCRDETILALAIETGARASEVLAVQRKDLFPDTNTVLIHGLKGSNDREIPIRPALMQVLLLYIPFKIKYRRLEYIWRKYRPCEKKLHSLRHTFAVNLYRKTRDIKLVQLALGHTSLMNTQVYVDFILSSEELARILD